MIVEMVTFEVQAGLGERFETVFDAVERIMVGSPGYRGHRLLRDVNVADRYVLLVNWREGHGCIDYFRKSGCLNQVRELLAPFHRITPVLSCLADVDGQTANALAQEPAWRCYGVD